MQRLDNPKAFKQVILEGVAVPPAFWRDLQEQFRTLEPLAPHGALWDPSAEPLYAMNHQGQWNVGGGPSDKPTRSALQARFRTLAERGAIAADLAVDGTYPVDAWLNKLAEGPYFVDVDVTVESEEEGLIPLEGGAIEKAAVASTDLCAELETAAYQQGSGTAPEILKPSWQAAAAQRDADSATRVREGEAATDQRSRRAAVDDFLNRCNELPDLPRKIRRIDFSRLGGRTDKGRQFQRWQARDPKATAADCDHFGKVLALEPAAFVERLRGKGLL